MNSRITTVGDLIEFNTDSINTWSAPLIRHLIPELNILLPDIPPAGPRIIRPGQFWASDRLRRQEGHIIEILGYLSPAVINGRRWVPLIPRTTGYPLGVILSKSGRGKQIWVQPALPGTSRGAGSTEDFLVADLLTETTYHMTLGPEVRSASQNEQGGNIDRTAKKVLYCMQERPPLNLPPVRERVSRQDFE